MTYEQALRFIEGTSQFGIKPGLARIKRMMELLGEPQEKLKIIHVAGTNAKGSVCAMIDSALRVAGYKTGLYTSPYVENFNERIKIDGKEIENQEIADFLELLLPNIKQVETEGFGEMTEFEIITALAFLYFYERGCDFVVLEVGLGGRLDATNVIGSPLLCVITSVSKDHTQILGNTLTEIAREKCGIIKQGRPVVVYPDQVPEALTVIENAAASKKAILIRPDREEISGITSDITGNSFTYKDFPIRTTLAGRHQIYNAVTAVEALWALRGQGVRISDEQITSGVGKCCFIGRLETLVKNPLVIMDGAHNPSGIDALCSAIDEFLPDRRIITVMGMMKDKDYPYAIGRVAAKSDVFVAVSPHNSRSLSAKECAAEARKVCLSVTEAQSVKQGIDYALSLCREHDALIVCGSLYLVGEARPYIRQK